MTQKNNSESGVVAEILTASNAIEGLSLYKNPVGKGKVMDSQGNYTRWITYGLKVNSADLIGLYSTEIKWYGRIAVFTSIETKRPKNAEIREGQVKWRNKIIDAGGIAMITNNVEEFKWVFEDPDKIFDRVRELAR